jgi:cell division septation protein DedD
MAELERPRRLRTEKQPPATCPPGWVWFLSGVLIGMFLSFLIYLQEVVPNHPAEAGKSPVLVPTVVPVNPVVATVQSSPRPEDKQITTPKPAKPVDTNSKFEFYETLPNPEKSPPPTTSEKTGTVILPAILQVGAFRDEQSAQGLKTHLSSFGVRAYVEQTTNGNEIWYRVRVGPVSNIGQYNQLVEQLSANNITADVLPLTR